MTQILYALPLLACPIGMGAMMWLMMRGRNGSSPSDSAAKQAELTALQAQIDQLKAQKRDSHRSGAEGL